MLSTVKFREAWAQIFKTSIGPRKSKGELTRVIIGRKNEQGLLKSAGEVKPLLFQVLALCSDKGADEEWWYGREVFSVDAVCFALKDKYVQSRDPWGSAFLAGDWRTIALFEHETTPGLNGILPTLRKLEDYSSDHQRVAMCYTSDVSKTIDALTKRGYSQESKSASSPILLVLGELSHGQVIAAWRILEVSRVK